MYVDIEIREQNGKILETNRIQSNYEYSHGATGHQLKELCISWVVCHNPTINPRGPTQTLNIKLIIPYMPLVGDYILPRESLHRYLWCLSLLEKCAGCLT